MGKFIQLEALLETKRYLDEEFKKGIALYIDDMPTSPDGIIYLMVKEDADYMPDYITDENNKLIQIRYDRVVNR